jgi:hypothetical protein
MRQFKPLPGAMAGFCVSDPVIALPLTPPLAAKASVGEFLVLFAAKKYIIPRSRRLRMKEALAAEKAPYVKNLKT